MMSMNFDKSIKQGDLKWGVNSRSHFRRKTSSGGGQREEAGGEEGTLGDKNNIKEKETLTSERKHPSIHT